MLVSKRWITQLVRGALSFGRGLDDAVIQGEGYEALITRNGIVVGRVYLGTVDEVEREARY